MYLYNLYCIILKTVKIKALKVLRAKGISYFSQSSSSYLLTDLLDIEDGMKDNFNS